MLHRKSSGESCLRTICPGVIEEQARRRCWWALYDLDRFCSMVYRHPMAICDEDCDVGPPPERQSVTAIAASLKLGSHDITKSLLSYKFHLSKLSEIIRDILSQLYRPRRNIASRESDHPKDRLAYDVKRLVGDVSCLDAKLRYWHTGLPDQIGLDWSPSVKSCLSRAVGQQIGGFGPEFEQYIL
jgi:hypothetical protein